ncbi:MAG TPA: tRNA (adenosine(37)-N6)-threonylcarbamoyltransferase complex transferase subunit TsaD [Casimicrobiaceae bacterium]|nr:tRNA (adenosine(37)-N6)-threonylcarbamoyltransferase complex transferase subunit TsaD [Casimicrobiaceae bacterium]
MLVLGIETSCDETGLALYDSRAGLLANALHSQAAMHQAYGGVVPELASRDHIRRVVPLIETVLRDAGRALREIDGIAYTQGPGLAGALLVGASIASALGFALGKPALGVHHLEGHLLSTLLGEPSPAFPFVALLVSGGHSQLYAVGGIGDYRLLGDTQDDAAGEAFDKTAKLLGLPYPGGPALSRLAERGRPGAVKLPRPMKDSGDLDMSFSGLKTAVLTLARTLPPGGQRDADIACEFEVAVTDVLVAKSLSALAVTGMSRLVVAGGVGANRRLRERLGAAVRAQGGEAFYPDLEFCTDNGAMIALVGALRLEAGLEAGLPQDYAFSVRPRWELSSVEPMV